MMDLRYDSSMTDEIEDPRPAGPRRNPAIELDPTLSVHPVDSLSAVDQPDVEEKVVASGPQDGTATTIGQELRSHQPATPTARSPATLLETPAVQSADSASL